jgi:tol-pal system protein YbgF
VVAFSLAFRVGAFGAGCATTNTKQAGERKILQDVAEQIKALDARMAEGQKNIETELDRVRVALSEVSQKQLAQEQRLTSLEAKSLQGTSGKPSLTPIPIMPPKVSFPAPQKPQKSPSLAPMPLRLDPLFEAKEEPNQTVSAVTKEFELLDSIEDPAVKLLLQAKKAVLQRDFAKARAVAQDLVLRHPKAEVGDDAQFLVGDTYFAQGLFANALYEYDTVVVRYPKGNKAPEALLKEAECYERLNLKEDALKVLGRLIRNYPDAPESVQARERMARLTSPAA